MRKKTVQPGISIPKDKIAEFCRNYHIIKLSLFGSVLGKDFGPGSDIDILVEFEPDHIPGLALITMQEELSGILGGRRVDLVTPKFLNRRIRSKVESEAVIQYAQR
jgi:predicted nucleotidyltransferase